MADFTRFQGPSAEWESFVQHNPLVVFDPTVGSLELRQATNALRIRLSQAEIEAEGLLTKASWQDFCISTGDKQNIIARVYRPSDRTTLENLPVFLYFHGGGHLFGTIETEDAACLRISSKAGMVVVNVGYRHTPEYTHPTQFNDAWDSFEWLAKNGDSIGGDTSRVVVGGLSAGAALAASVAWRQHGLLREANSVAPSVTICGQLLCVPWLMHPDNPHPARHPSGSITQNVEAPVLPRTLLRLFTDLLGKVDLEDALLNIAVVEESTLVGMPKSSFLVAGQDLLRDDGLIYAEALQKMGVPTKVHVFPGMPHAFRRYGQLQSSRRWDELLVEGLMWCLDSQTRSSTMVTEST